MCYKLECEPLWEPYFFQLKESYDILGLFSFTAEAYWKAELCLRWDVERYKLGIITSLAVVANKATVRWALLWCHHSAVALMPPITEPRELTE